MMLEGTRPKECDYCWRVEDASTSEYSDRTIKSAMPWASPYIDEIASKPWDDNVDPSYVEVSFSNVCNFKCSYCAPHISSKWMEEIEQHGAYPSGYNNIEWIKASNMMPIPNREENPYVDAFWSWWPTMYKQVQHFRITGGEPLLSKDTFKVLDYIIENDANQNLKQLGINSNLNVPDELFNKFIEKIKIIVETKKVGSVKIFTSAEAHGSAAEYIRFGMSYDRWLENLYRVSRELPNVGVTIMSTYNILSIGTYKKFLYDILQWKKEFLKVDENPFNRFLDIPYLRYPDHQSIFIMEPELIGIIKDQVDFMKSSEVKGAYTNIECGKMQVIYDMALGLTETSRTRNDRKNFVSFVDEHDRRRGTNFIETFPELESSYRKWKHE